MDQIMPHALWVGMSDDCRDYGRLFQAGIRALVHLPFEESPPHSPREIICFRIPITDSAGNPEPLLTLAISAVADLLQMQIPTLVCCAAGVSRSPAITAAALSLVTQQPPEACLKLITHHHPCNVTAGLWNDLVRLLRPRARK